MSDRNAGMPYMGDGETKMLAKELAPWKYPTARAIQILENQGFIAEKVEQFIRQGKAGFRKDFLGFLDVIAVPTDGSKGLLGVQVTAGGNGMARVYKIQGECTREFDAWRGSGNRVEVWDFRRRKKGGKVVAIENVILKP